MGIPRGTARLLLEESRRQPFTGDVLQVGRSSIYFTEKELRSWAPRHGVELRQPNEVTFSHDPRLAHQRCLSDRTFFSMLGFDRVECCDISDWEGAEHIFNLNEPAPSELHGRFDAILDPGSINFIFHLPNVLKNFHDLLKVGGRIVHAGVPSNNHVDLAFYMFSPTFFDDFYRANGYRVEVHYLCQCYPYWHLGRLHSAPWKIYRYEPGCLDHLSYGRFGGRQVAIFLVATKTAESTGDVVPQLGQFVRTWKVYDEQKDDPEAVAGDFQTRKTGLAAFADRQFLAHPALSRAYLPVKRTLERLRRLLPQRMPPLVARY
jgi:hypothetical protein